MSKAFRILAIDGGGFRGVYSAYLLKRIEETYGMDWQKDFDLIAGTSTGSIIAAGLACGMSAADILDFYEKHGKRIFTKRWFCKIGLFGSRYHNGYLKGILKEVLGDRKLNEITVPLILPATDIGNGCVHVFKSAYHGEFVRDGDVLVRDAVLASCSAPTYFNPHKVDKYLLADGGLWANSPSLVAAIDAKKRLGVDLGDLKILSVGTGVGKEYYSQSQRWWRRFLGWGFVTRWGKSKLIDMVLNLQAQNANNMVGLLLQGEQIMRLNFESDSALPMDDVREFDGLVSLADKDFTHNSQKIREFLGDKMPQASIQKGDNDVS